VVGVGPMPEERGDGRCALIIISDSDSPQYLLRQQTLSIRLGTLLRNPRGARGCMP